MKRFVVEYLFVAVLVAAQCGVIYWQGHDYVHDSNNLYKYNYIQQHGSEIKTLILGHSQAANGINPWVMGDSVFNMAELSRIMYYDREILVRNISAMPNLKAVIYPLMYQLDNGAFFTQESFRKFSINEYKRTMGISAPPKYERDCSYRPKPLDVINYHFYVSTRDCDSLGYMSLGNSFSDAVDFINTDVDDDSIIDMLSAMASVCDENGVRFIVISMPCNNTFNNQLVDSMGVDRINRIIESVQTRYPMEYRDYLNHSDFRYEDIYQRQTHLNNKGATLFAQRIKKDLEL